MSEAEARIKEATYKFLETYLDRRAVYKQVNDILGQKCEHSTRMDMIDEDLNGALLELIDEIFQCPDLAGNFIYEPITPYRCMDACCDGKFWHLKSVSDLRNFLDHSPILENSEATDND